MQQIIIKRELEAAKIDALINFLKAMEIDAELRTSSIETKRKSDFTLSKGLWKDYDIEATELRNIAWSRGK